MLCLRRLACFSLAGACCCGGHPSFVAGRDSPAAVVALAAAEPQPLPAPTPLVPYAPTRTSATDYVWQRSPRADCAPRSPIRFAGSHGEFPLLPEDDAGAAAAPEAPDTWGTGRHQTSAEPLAARSPEQVVAALRPRLRRCFSSWLERSGANEGSVRFALEIDCGGEVGAVTAKSSRVDESTVTCLFGVVTQASFVAPAAGHATLEIPVVFKTAER